MLNAKFQVNPWSYQCYQTFLETGWGYICVWHFISIYDERLSFSPILLKKTSDTTDLIKDWFEIWHTVCMICQIRRTKDFFLKSPGDPGAGDFKTQNTPSPREGDFYLSRGMVSLKPFVVKLARMQCITSLILQIEK